MHSKLSQAWPALVLACTLAACANTAPSGPVAPPPTGTCDADRAQFAVGEPVTDRLVRRARERSNSKDVRVIRPGDVVTLEYNPNRLNLRVNAAGRVRQASCG